MTPPSTDVVIVGGSLAGAACAIELARAGIGAVALDRRAPGKGRVCGAFLSPGAVGALDRLDLLAEVRAAGAVPIEAARLRAGAAGIEIPFDRAALGFSRRRLDAIVARRASVEMECAVERIESQGAGYRVRVTGAGGAVRTLSCRVVVDAAGRSSRFSRRTPGSAYGVQFESEAPGPPILEFGFFEGGYGGSVSVEGGRRNSCFLLDRKRARDYARRRGWLVTGPISYRSVSSPYLTVGDAAGMIDPFCGEGMRHAMESGCVAARAIARALAGGESDAEACRRYRAEWSRQWTPKRRLAARLRWMLVRESAASLGLRLGGRFPSLVRACLEELWR